MLTENLDTKTIGSHKTGLTTKLAVLSAVALFGASFALVGCETTEGAGEDIEDAGEAIQDAAN